MHRRIKGLGLGLIGGVAGLAAMQLAHRIMKPAVKRVAPPPVLVTPRRRSMSLIGPHHQIDESATDALGRIVYSKVTHRVPSSRVKSGLSWGVHLGHGLTLAGLYGVVRGRPLRVPHAIGSGALFGLVLWLVGDELVVPLLGLADRPSTYAAVRHVDSLVAHLAYGITTAAAANALARGPLRP